MHTKRWYTKSVYASHSVRTGILLTSKSRTSPMSDGVEEVLANGMPIQDRSARRASATWLLTFANQGLLS
jgi:hypothetical protein